MSTENDGLMSEQAKTGEFKWVKEWWRIIWRKGNIDLSAWCVDTEIDDVY